MISLLITLWLVEAAGCAWLARARNRSEWGWAVTGFFFGPIALIILAASRPVPDWRMTREQATKPLSYNDGARQLEELRRDRMGE